MKAMRFLRYPWFLLGLGLWQLVVVFTPVSLYGFWTDALFAIACFGIVVYGLFSRLFKPSSTFFDGIMLGFAALSLCVLVFFGATGGLFALFELVGTSSIPGTYQVNGLIMEHKYFRPTGAWGCGMGSLTTAKAMVFFPLVEYRTDFDPCTHEDWGYVIEHGSWEGWDAGPAQ